MRETFARWSDPALTLTVGGVGITIPPPTIRVGLQLKAMYADLLAGESADIPDLPALLLDGAQLPDRLTAFEVQHIARTAAAHFGGGPALSEHVWRSLDPNRDEPTAPTEPVQLLGPWGWYDPAPRAYGDDDPGGGPYNPHTGYRQWCNDPADTPDKPAMALTWSELFERWDAVVCDFQQHYGVDLDELADTRSITWLETRLAGLQEIPDSRIRILTNAKEAPRELP
ncbi:hypothetical protein [Tsukamurella sp. NPDC003166]|uniref:DUF7426 family protein n=1 Tax=Tsukamurella sp. NPDC003166 TaxID=3154444 RepID=UPI0033A7BC4A